MANQDEQEEDARAQQAIDTLVGILIGLIGVALLWVAGVI